MFTNNLRFRKVFLNSSLQELIHIVGMWLLDPLKLQQKRNLRRNEAVIFALLTFHSTSSVQHVSQACLRMDVIWNRLVIFKRILFNLIRLIPINVDVFTAVQFMIIYPEVSIGKNLFSIHIMER